MPADPYLTDDENPEQIRAMRPASEAFPASLYENLVARYEARRSGARRP